MKPIPYLHTAGLGMKIAALLFICLLCATISSFFAVFVGILIWDLPVDALQQYDRYGSHGIALMKFTQAFSSIGLFVLPPFIFARITGTKAIHFLKLDQRPYALLVLFSCILMFFQLPWINALGNWNDSIEWHGMLRPLYESLRTKEDAAARLIEQFLYMPSPLELLQSLVVVALIPALGEELLFRGVVQPLVSKSYGIHAGVWITAFAFSFIHFQFFGFFPRLLLGALLGYLAVWSGSLWYAIAAHFANNAMAVLGYYGEQHNWTIANQDFWNPMEESNLTITISMILSIVCTYGFFKFASGMRDKQAHR